jgi:hypothetical protein
MSGSLGSNDQAASVGNRLRNNRRLPQGDGDGDLDCANTINDLALLMHEAKIGWRSEFTGT